MRSLYFEPQINHLVSLCLEKQKLKKNNMRKATIEKAAGGEYNPCNLIYMYIKKYIYTLNK